MAGGMFGSWFYSFHVRNMFRMTVYVYILHSLYKMGASFMANVQLAMDDYVVSFLIPPFVYTKFETEKILSCFITLN